MFKQFLRVQFHTRIEHYKEYTQLAQHFNGRRWSDDTQKRGAEDNPRKQFPQYHGQTEAGKQKPQHPRGSQD